MRARVIVALLVCGPMALVYACGGTGGDDASTLDSGNDVTVAGDTGTTGDTGSGGDTGNGGDTGVADSGGADSSSGGDASTSDAGSDGGGLNGFTCTTPSDCTSGFCCGTIVFNGGTIPHCDLGDASSACTTTCKSNVSLSCTATETVRGCAAKNDCLDAGTGYTSCCNVPFGDASVEFCWAKALATYIGGSCL